MCTVGESHELEQFHSASMSFACATSGNEGRNHDVLYGGELWQQLMELEHETDVLVTEVTELALIERCDVDAVDDDGSRIRTVEGADDLQESGLTCSRRSDNADNLAFLNVEVDAFQHLQ